LIQFAKHHAKWHIIGLALIVLVTGYIVVKLISDAKKQPVKVTVVRI
jgi:hypothetical protein